MRSAEITSSLNAIAYPLIRGPWGLVDISAPYVHESGLGKGVAAFLPTSYLPPERVNQVGNSLHADDFSLFCTFEEMVLISELQGSSARAGDGVSYRC
ncbi:hypothetical protein CEXT_348801 [Caerostris extrusa]|uniref:Uncharacterized protein n=1 Tax=Caerostris extrusa TaxID=172846 RepID=A0AAV4XPB3_CAEEX|nr:hypothetical protein CEXT_348801 [Caerostris extrusa]